MACTSRTGGVDQLLMVICETVTHIYAIMAIGRPMAVVRRGFRRCHMRVIEG